MPNYQMEVALPQITHNGKVYLKGDKIFTQVLSAQEAEIINNDPYLTGMRAIPTEKSPRMMAKELGIKHPKNISDEKLQEKIDEFKSQI